MRYLFIDTSHGVATALVDTAKNEVISREISETRSQVEHLMPLVDEVLGNQPRPDCVIVSRGPAPFTGLRVGLVSARALGFSWDVPVLGVDELHLQAFAALRSLPEKDKLPRWVVSVIDARRHEVYAAAFAADPDLERRSEDWVGKLTDLEAQLSLQCPGFPADLEMVVTVGDKAPELEWGHFVTVSPAKLALAAGGIVSGALEKEPATTDASQQLRALSADELAAAGLETAPAYLRRPDIHQRS